MLAGMAGLSSAYFGKIFATQIGYSFSDYLSNTRMKKAEQLLRETKLPINQISEAIGIVNTNYFYSIFKKKYGMTPLATAARVPAKRKIQNPKNRTKRQSNSPGFTDRLRIVSS